MLNGYNFYFIRKAVSHENYSILLSEISIFHLPLFRTNISLLHLCRHPMELLCERRARNWCHSLEMTSDASQGKMQKTRCKRKMIEIVYNKYNLDIICRCFVALSNHSQLRYTEDWTQLVLFVQLKFI